MWFGDWSSYMSWYDLTKDRFDLLPVCLPSASNHGAMQLEGLYQMESWFVLPSLQEREKETILLYELISLQYSVTAS